MVEIESGDVTAMVDSSSAELLQEIDEKKKKLRFGPIVTILAILCALGLFAGEALLLLQIFVAIVGVLGIYFAFFGETRWRKRWFSFTGSIPRSSEPMRRFMSPWRNSRVVLGTGTSLHQRRSTSENITRELQP
jgi:hypothetical protein